MGEGWLNFSAHFIPKSMGPSEFYNKMPCELLSIIKLIILFRIKLIIIDHGRGLSTICRNYASPECLFL